MQVNRLKSGASDELDNNNRVKQMLETLRYGNRLAFDRRDMYLIIWWPIGVYFLHSLFSPKNDEETIARIIHIVTVI